MSATATATTPERAQPQSLRDLYWSFTVLALQGFGGVLAVAQRELVEKKRWLSQAEFVEEWAVAQIMPGPNIVNLALALGARSFGLRGALTALAGMLSIPLLIVLGLAVLYTHFAAHPGVAGALRGMSAVAAGLIIATGLRLLPALAGNPLGRTLCLTLAALCFAAIAWLHWPLLYVLGALGGLAYLLVWRRLPE